MNAVVFVHVKVGDLPESWRAQLTASPEARVTVRIEEETANRSLREQSDNPLFGLWRDREDMVEVDAYVRKLRVARF